MIQMDCLLAMNRYREALNVYEDTTMLFFEQMDLSRSKKMLDHFRTMSSQLHDSMGALAEIKSSMSEKEFIPGAYYCSYPSFIDSYRMISRTLERSGSSIFLMLCTITNNRGNPIEKDDILRRQTKNLSRARVMSGAENPNPLLCFFDSRSKNLLRRIKLWQDDKPLEKQELNLWVSIVLILRLRT